MNLKKRPEIHVLRVWGVGGSLFGGEGGGVLSHYLFLGILSLHGPTSITVDHCYMVNYMSHFYGTTCL